MKWIIITLLLLGMVQIVIALEDCQRETEPKDVPCFIITPAYNDTCGNVSIDIYNNTPTLLDTRIMDTFGSTGRCNTTFNFTAEADYLFNFSTGDSGRITVKAVDNMASLAIMLFVMAITGFLLALPFIKQKFSSNSILNEILRRSCWIMGLFLLSLDTAMAATIADTAGLGLSQEIFRYLFLINWAVYLLILFTVIQFFFRILKLWKVQKYEARTGLEYGEEKQ